jgi:hypothetical protein
LTILRVIWTGEESTMMVKAVLLVKGEVIGEVHLPADGTPSHVARAAYRNIRRAFPQLSLTDSGVRVTFERLEGTGAR